VVGDGYKLDHLGSISFMNVIIEPEKNVIAIYPIFLFYLFIDWFLIFIWAAPYSYPIVSQYEYQSSVVFLLDYGYEGSPSIERVPEGTLTFDVVLIKVPTFLPIATHSWKHILPDLMIQLLLLRIVQLQPSEEQVVQVYPHWTSPVRVYISAGLPLFSR
jgi:hypothetical protein